MSGCSLWLQASEEESRGRETDAVRFHVAHDRTDIHGAEPGPEHRAGAELVRLVVEDVPVAEVRVVGCCAGHPVFSANEVGGEEGLAFDLVILCLDITVMSVSLPGRMSRRSHVP